MRKKTLMFVMAISVSLVLAACGGTTTSKPLTLQQIVDKTNTAYDKDATFTMALDGTISSVAVHLTGTGTTTAFPYRVSTTLIGTTNAVAIVEQLVFTDSAMYQTSYRGTQVDSHAKWTVASGNALGLRLGDFIGYHMRDPKLVGVEVLGKVRTYHLVGTPAYNGTFVAPPSDVQETADAWFDATTFRPLKVTERFTNNKGVQSTLTYTFTKWNSGVQITLPDPANIVHS
jgi:outer membrane lipoprotein-sorting protein